jgi:GAF domain-containing protein
MESIVTLKESEIQSWITGLKVNLDIVISGEGVLRDMNTVTSTSSNAVNYQAANARLREHFKWASETMGFFEELFLMDTTGKVLLSTNEAHEGEKHIVYTYFTEGMKGHYVQQPSYSLSSGKMIVVASSPIEDGGKALGVLTGRAGLESLNEIMLERSGLGETGETYLVGANHRLLTNLRNASYVIPETYVRTDGTDRAIGDRTTGSDTYRNYDGDPVIGVYRWLPDLQVALIAEQNEGEAFHATNVAFIVIVGMAIIVVFIAILLATFLSSSIVEPLSELATTAKKIAEGDLDRIARVERSDEVGTVAKAFNSMTGQLRKLVRGLQRRTDQLRAINEVGRHISSILSLDELLPFVVNSFRETFNYYNVNVFLTDPISGDLILRAGVGGYRGDAPIGLPLHAATGIVGWVAQTGEPLLANDVSKEPKFIFLEELADTQSELAVPIRISHETLGVLDIESAELNAFDEVDLFTAQTLADQIAIAIQSLDENVENAHEHLDHARRLARESLSEARRSVWALRPQALEQLPLIEALRQEIEKFTRDSGVKANFSTSGKRQALHADMENTLLRICQESLANVKKHAKASKVEVKLSFKGKIVRLIVHDNGIGFDSSVPAEGSFGLIGMNERARLIGGTMVVRSEAGKGTLVEVIVPVIMGAI